MSSRGPKTVEEVHVTVDWVKELREDLRRIDNPFCERELRIKALESILSEQLLFPAEEESPFYEMDFHLHSNYSDGYWTPTGLLLEAYRLGMKCISLTDHDCFEGVEEAFEARERIEKLTGNKIIFVPGIEFSTLYKDDKSQSKEIHILGYFPSRDYKEFRSYLDRIDIYTEAYLDAFQKCRVLRIYEMVKTFNEQLPLKVGGMLLELSKCAEPISLPTARRGLRGSVAPGRLLACTGIYEIAHLQKLGRLCEISDETFSERYIENVVDFMAPFDSPHQLMVKYFDKEKPSAKVDYIGKTFNSRSVVTLIGELRGIPVLAHPILYPDLFESILEDVVPLGLRGVEVISSNSTGNDVDRLVRMDQYIEKRYPDLIITAGSDCHGHSTDGTFNYTPKIPMGLKRDMEGLAELITKHDPRMKSLFKERGRGWA